MIPQILKNVDVEIMKSEAPQRVVTIAERLGLDIWDWIAIIIAVASLLVAILAAWWQHKTEKNTMKITEEGQFDLLVDYFRHFYANIIVVLAVYHKLDKRYETHYPSEEHFRKLTVELDVLHPEAFFHSKDKYNSIHNLYLLIRNFNSECGVAEEHICKKNIFIPAKERDINTLIFKQDYFVGRFSDCIRELCMPEKKRKKARKKENKKAKEKAKEKAETKWQQYITRAHDDILKRAFERNKLFEDQELTSQQKAERLKGLIKEKKIPNFWSHVSSSNFVNILFPNDSEIFTDLLNYNIWCEINGKNSQGYDKIFILPFE